VAKGTLGPFPKTRRWREIVASAQPSASHAQIEMLSDLLLCRLKSELEKLEKDPAAIRALLFWVVLPIATRAADPIHELRQTYGIELTGPTAPELADALDRFVGVESPTKSATKETITEIHPDDALLSRNGWDRWRRFDGPDFCNLAYRFFTNLSIQLYANALPEASPEAIETFAKESAIITRAFSARWFNACAREETPGQGSVRWYWGHCLGKLDLEASREMSDWVEPPKRRKGQPEPTLDL
jgi:hypothetical protein